MKIVEHVISVIFSVWGTEEGLFKHGKEGMLILTKKRVAFILKTTMSLIWWQNEVERQLKVFKQSNNTIRVSEEYTAERLEKDLEIESNMNIPLNLVISVEAKRRGWGSELKLKFRQNKQVRAYTFAIVKGWTTYPLKDPIAFLNVDWCPWVNAIRTNV